MQRYSKFLLTTHALRGLAYQSRKLHGTPDKSLALTTPTFVNPPNPPELATPTLVSPPPGSTPRYDGKPNRPHICETFYRTSIQIPYFSCDWDKWTFKNFFRVGNSYPGVTSAEWVLKHLLRVHGDVFPLAYLNGSEVLLLFEADAKYYLLDLNNDRLLHFGAKFASHDDFLSRWDACPHDVQYLPDMDRECAEMMGKRRPALDPLEAEQARRREYGASLNLTETLE